MAEFLYNYEISLLQVPIFKKKVILNGWDFQNFWEAQVEKCGQNFKNAQSPWGQENIFSNVFLNAH